MLAIESRHGDIVHTWLYTGSPHSIALIELDCAAREVTPREFGVMEENGEITQRQAMPAARQSRQRAEGIFNAVLDISCAAPERIDRPSGGVSGATANEVTRMLNSEDETLRALGIEKVLAEPGGYPPLVLANLANALFQAGRAEEAHSWWVFGYVRTCVDLYALAPDDRRLRNIIVPMYQFRVHSDLAESMRVLSLEHRVALFDRAFVEDARVPRYYPVDWGGWNSLAADIDWASSRGPRPGTDFAVRPRLADARVAVEALMREPPE